MRTLLALVVICTLLAINIQAAPDLEGELKELFPKGKYLVLKRNNIPSVGVNKLETLGLNNYVHLRIQPDGTWKEKKLLGLSKTSARIDRGTILKIRKTRLKKNWFGIFTHTEKTILIEDRSHSRDASLVHYNVFSFKFDPSNGIEDLQASISQYFDVYDTLKEAEDADKIQIDSGMTIREVLELLGTPQIRANLGDRVKFKYDGVVVIFVDGKVADVDF